MSEKESVPVLRLERTVASSPERAFEKFTHPEHMSRWFTTVVKAELAVGGRYSNSDGDRGEFLAIQRPRRVEFTWENPKHCPGTRVAVTFTGRGDEVSVVLEHRGFASREDREHMAEGWSWALDSYASYVTSGKPIEHEAWLESRGTASEGA